MGMFDHVNVEVDLPDDVDNDLHFQTKAFHCYMDVITITKDGRLIVPDCFNDDRERDANFHGEFNFYTHTPDKEWIEFKAKFIEGDLVEIVRIERDW